jgi:hypothetical protein
VRWKLDAKVRPNGKFCNEKKQRLRLLGENNLPFGEGDDVKNHGVDQLDQLRD